MNQKTCKLLRRWAEFSAGTTETAYNDTPKNWLERFQRKHGIVAGPTRRLIPTCFRGVYQQLKKEALRG